MSSKKPPVSINKDDAQKLVSEHLTDLRDFSANFKKMVEGLESSSKYDVSIGTLEDTMKILSSLQECKTTLEKIKKTLKLRAATRLREF